jgi:hypothetical protein
MHHAIRIAADANEAKYKISPTPLVDCSSVNGNLSRSAFEKMQRVAYRHTARAKWLSQLSQ